MKLVKKIVINAPYFFAALAFVFALGAFVNFQEANRDRKKTLPMTIDSSNWPTTEGTIIKHKIYEKHTGRYSHSPNTHYFAEPYYRFVVANKKYLNFRICYYHSNCGIGTKRTDAKKLLAQYPIGSKVKVYYNPKNPKQSVLRQVDFKKFEKEIAEGYKRAIIFLIITVLLLTLNFIYYKSKRIKQLNGE